jgi:predicted RNA binding protein YcfA (HicA-like mRNA interferase family)
MVRLPILKPRKLVRILRDMGFVPGREKIGSHQAFEHPDGRTTEVPHHGGKDIRRKLLEKILQEIEIDHEEFMKWL